MANSNFVVHNGLTVGPLTIDAATGSISTSGNVNITGNLGVTQISKADSSISINDTGGYSNVLITVDGSLKANVNPGGFDITNGNISLNNNWINGAGGINATGNVLGKVGTFNSLTLNGALTGTGVLNTSGNVLAATGIFSAVNVNGLFNATGNVLAAAGIFNGLTVNGSLSSTGFINTSGNVSGAVVLAGSLTSTGFINTSGNVSAAVHTGGQVAVSGLINTAGNVLAATGIFNALTVNGSLSSTGFINTSGNVSAAVLTGGQVAVSGLINTAGNVLAATGIFNALNVNGTLSSTGFINTSGNVSAAVHTGGAVTISGVINTLSNVLCLDATIDSLGVGTTPSGVTGEIRATNNITAYFSDQRLKENIAVIPDALGKLDKISGVTYTSNDLAATFGYTDKTEQVGVLAQELKQVLPHVVKLAPFDTEYVNGVETSKSGENYMTVQYERIIPLLVQAIKELKAEVDQLKNKE